MPKFKDFTHSSGVQVSNILLVTQKEKGDVKGRRFFLTNPVSRYSLRIRSQTKKLPAFVLKLFYILKITRVSPWLCSSVGWVLSHAPRGHFSVRAHEQVAGSTGGNGSMWLSRLCFSLSLCKLNLKKKSLSACFNFNINEYTSLISGKEFRLVSGE